MNPTATFYLSGGGKIVVELLPDYAPNTVNSFIHCALSGALDNWPIQRIVPGSWIDLSYTAFKNDVCKYLIPRESVLNPHLPLLDSVPGCMCMGGYGERGNAGCEPFFPLRPCPTASLLQDPPSLAVPQPKTAFRRQNATFAVHFSCRQNVDN